MAMSGGVDSSAAAVKLLQQGYNVIGVTMKLWDYENVKPEEIPEKGCCSLSAAQDAESVCRKFGIPFHYFDFSPKFRRNVINNFIHEYKEGKTPNPCIICNAKIKWEALLEKTAELGAHYMATGHYAGVRFNAQSGRYELFKSKDSAKDQSYALWGLTQESLSRTLFPLTDMSKPQVRQLAAENGIITAHKPESQEICFIPDNNYHRFLKENIKNLEKTVAGGPIKDLDGNILGKHKGYPFYTIGQRRGLGMGFGKPVYVVKIDALTNTVYIGDKKDLLAKGLKATGLNLIKYAKLEEPLAATVKIRYNDQGRSGTVIQKDEKNFEVIFDEPAEAVTPGQSVVFYVGDEVIGGGIISEKIN